LFLLRLLGRKCPAKCPLLSAAFDKYMAQQAVPTESHVMLLRRGAALELSGRRRCKPSRFSTPWVELLAERI
jgi:hypothetical protein